MTTSMKTRCIGLWIISVIAIAFGLLTLKSGGEVLFMDGAGREAAGNFVPFVLWFNFLAGFAYIIAGAGLFLQYRRTWILAGFIAIATLVVFAAFGAHIMSGGNYEMRTIAAMSLRSTLWMAIAIIARKLWSR